MKCSSDSAKHESKTHNEDFSFDLDTPRGHFFAVVDFASHDFANLNATLKGKLETIVGSFVSLSRFSADLFLGFLAKEINNFLYNLREQAGGPELVGSAVLCLLSGNRLTYFLCGDVAISIHNAGRVLPLQGGEPNENGQVEKLGMQNQDAPLSDAVQTFILEDNDVVVIMTAGLEGAVDSQRVGKAIGANAADPKLICAQLMKASGESKDDRTAVVITGPYERYVDPILSDLSKALVTLESRVDALAASNQEKNQSAASSDSDTVTQLIENFTNQVELLKEEIRTKAGRIDVLELQEQVKSFGVLLAGKADTTELLSVQSDVLKLGVASPAGREELNATPKRETLDEVVAPVENTSAEESRRRRNLLFQVAAIVAVLGFAGAFAGAWLQSRLMRRSSTANVAAPAATTSPVVLPSPQPTPSVESTPAITEITVKPGDSLKKLAQQYNVPQERIAELNPGVTRWATIQAGQKINVPVTQVAPGPAASPEASPVANTTAGTIEVIVAPGDSINRFAHRFNTTPQRIRELNPQITNWGAIQTGQKLLMPAPSG
jgi:LysM repeat protein